MQEKKHTKVVLEFDLWLWLEKNKNKKNYTWIPWILPSGLLFISLFSNILDDCAMLSVQLFSADIWNQLLNNFQFFFFKFVFYSNRSKRMRDRERENETRKALRYIFISSNHSSRHMIYGKWSCIGKSDFFGSQSQAKGLSTSGAYYGFVLIYSTSASIFYLSH